ncbi:hypothetical protein C1T30_42900, partial [Bacillus sp. MBGLi97]
AKYKKIHSQTVFDWKSDLFKIDEFFNRSDVPHITGASIVNNVGGCKYYNRFSEEDNTAFMKRLEEAKIFTLKIMIITNRMQGHLFLIFYLAR